MEFETKHHDMLPRAQVKNLSRRIDEPGVWRLLVHFLIVAAATVLNSYVWGPLGFLTAILQGAVMVTLFAPLHECIHRTAFEDRQINDWVARICGAILFLPADFFRFFHFAHHRHTQDSQQDPELRQEKPADKVSYFLHLTGLYYWLRQVEYLISAIGGRVTAPYIPEKRHREVIFEARCHAALYAVAFALLPVFGIWVAYEFWLLPVILGQPLLRAYLLAEHGGCPEEGDMFRNTRTVFSNLVTRFMMWNMPCHTAHHVYPSVPFHALPELQEAIEKDLQVTESGYFAFHRQYWRGLN